MKTSPIRWKNLGRSLILLCAAAGNADSFFPIPITYGQEVLVTDPLEFRLRDAQVLVTFLDARGKPICSSAGPTDLDGEYEAKCTGFVEADEVSVFAFKYVNGQLLVGRKDAVYGDKIVLKTAVAVPLNR